MNIETKYFGTHNYEQKKLITLSDGLYGFENEKQFILMPFDKSDDSMMVLQSVNKPEVAFVVFKPTVIDPIYSPTLTASQKKSIDLTSIYDLSYYVIAVVYDNFKDTVANLKCPVAINTKSNLAIQIILEGTEYTFRHPVFDDKGGDC